MLVDAANLARMRDAEPTAEAWTGPATLAEFLGQDQVLGEQGYMKDHPLERHYRDARQLMIVEGTSQVQRVVISRAMIDRALVYG